MEDKIPDNKKKSRQELETGEPFEGVPDLLYKLFFLTDHQGANSYTIPVVIFVWTGLARLCYYFSCLVFYTNIKIIKNSREGQALSGRILVAQFMCEWRLVG